MDQYAGAGGWLFTCCIVMIFVLTIYDIDCLRVIAGNGSKGIVKVLVGNKCDKDREVPEHIAEQFAENNNFNLFMETSALQAENVERLFYEIAETLVERSLANQNNPPNPTPNPRLEDPSTGFNRSSCMSCQFS